MDTKRQPDASVREKDDTVDQGAIARAAGARDTRIPNSEAWMLRPILWFAAANIINGILHEFAHAVTTYCLGIRSTLFHDSVDVDVVQTTPGERALIGVAGPIFSLGFGVLCWFALRRCRNSAAELPLIYLSVFGVSMFFGNLMSASFVGDLANAALALNVPMTLRYTATVVGAILLVAALFAAGRELYEFVPPSIGPLAGMFGVIALPALVGTAAVILVHQPMPRSSVMARASEGLIWVFAAIGALATPTHSRNARASLRLRWTDGAFGLVAVLAVRLMARAIQVVP